MKLLILFFICWITTVLSTIMSPLLDDDAKPLMMSVDVHLSRPDIELCITSPRLSLSPQDYKPFIEWLFHQPEFMINHFVFMLTENMIPLEIVHVGLSACTGSQEVPTFSHSLFNRQPPLYLANTGYLIDGLVRYMKSFGGFHPEFYHLCQIAITNIPEYETAMAFFKMVEELQGDFKKCLTREVAQYFLNTQIDESWTFCCSSLLEADWLSLDDLSLLLFAYRPFDLFENWSMEQNNYVEAIFEKAKTFITDEVAASTFLESLQTFLPQFNDLLRWIVSQPWVSSDLINYMIRHDDCGDSSIDLELILHDKATSVSVTELELEKFDSDNPLLPIVHQRIVEILKRELSEQEFHSYIAGIPQSSSTPATRELVKYILNSSTEYFLPCHNFFPQFAQAYKSLDSDDMRKPIFALDFLDVLGNSMSEEDMDYLLEFLFGSRSRELCDDSGIWTEVAEKVLRISFSKSQTLVHMAKNFETSFFHIHDITNTISQLATDSFEQTLEELKQAHTQGDQYIQKLAQLGKYEKVFLMLTAPTISKLYSYALKSLDPRFTFMKSARKLNMSNVRALKSEALFVCQSYQEICDASTNKSLRKIKNLSEMMVVFEKFFHSDEHEDDHWMVRDIAEMLLEYPRIDELPLNYAAIEFLKMVTSDSGLKRARPADMAQESEAKRQRHF